MLFKSFWINIFGVLTFPIKRIIYIIFNLMDGIYLSFTANNFLSNNIIKDNGQQGIFLFLSYYNIINENQIFLNKWDGIHFRNLCSGNRVTCNTINSNNIDGIKLKNSIITDNNKP